MCGICGFYGKKNRDLLEAMKKVLIHRGPDDEGYYEDDFVSLGHRRLSIIDLSEHGRQPMSNEDASIWAVVNGEVYNYRELENELSGYGHCFRSQSDSEVVIHAYEQYGEDFPAKLEGMFAVALWDSRQKKLILARDRIGIKPLYYAHNESRLLFASEIKAILQDVDFRRQLNTEGLSQYLAFQCIITEDTMFKGIYKIEPGTLLVFKGNRLTKKKYWSLAGSGRENVTGQDAGRVLTDAVRSHLVSDVPLGVLLSGGLDSSSIVALMRRLGRKEIDTFTVGFGQPDDEFNYAKDVADRFNTRHHEISINAGQMKDLLAKIVWHMDEPLADGGAIATYLAASRLKDFVKVVLVGEGGDETFGGYNWYMLNSFPFNLIPEQMKKRIYFYLTTYYKGGPGAPYNLFLDLFKNERSFLGSMSGFEIKYILPNSLLMKVDKMTMAHSIEARVPFLDHKVVEFMALVAPGYKVRGFKSKYILRRCMDGILPQQIASRRKHGFLLPINQWVKKDLKDYVQSIILERSSYIQGIFSRGGLSKLFRKQLNPFREVENSSLIWRLFIFELWHREYIRSFN